MIPSKMPDDLSRDARTLLRECYREGGVITVLDSQVHVGVEIAQAFLGSLHLGKYDNVLRATRLAKHFTVADGTGHPHLRGLYAEVEMIQHTETTGENVLLACLLGAEFHRLDSARGLPWAQWRLIVNHPTATDVEHDRSMLACLRIDNPTPVAFSSHATTLVGVLTEARLYPRDVEPLLLDERSPDAPLAEPEMCPGEKGEGGPHPFAPYQPPPRLELDCYLGQPVRLTLRALDSVDRRGLPRGTVTTVTTDED